MRLLLAPLLTVGLVLSACGSEESDAEAAQKEVCTDASDVKSNLGALADAISDRDLSLAEDAYSELVTSVEELNGGLEDLGSAQREAIQPQLDAIQSAVDDVDDADLSTLGDSLSSIQSEVEQAADTIRSTSALDC
jgi:hypothetical protein